MTSLCQGLSSLALGGGERETLGTRLAKRFLPLVFVCIIQSLSRISSPWAFLEKVFPCRSRGRMKTKECFPCLIQIHSVYLIITVFKKRHVVFLSFGFYCAIKSLFDDITDGPLFFWRGGRMEMFPRQTLFLRRCLCKMFFPLHVPADNSFNFCKQFIFLESFLLGFSIPPPSKK